MAKMDKEEMAEKQPRRAWRKLVKKLQRKKRRQKQAKEREKQEEKVELAKLNDSAYQQWLQQQQELEESQRLNEKRLHDEEEEAWLRRELIAQRQFRLEQKQREADEAEKEALRKEQEKELEGREAAQRQRCEEQKRLAAEAAAEFECLMSQMEQYLEDTGIETPIQLKHYVETRPGQKLCEFYERTNCCRFGAKCSCNHRRPLLGRIILIHHFYAHPMLETIEHHEYAAADSSLESTEMDLRMDYDAFFEDVLPELESFGKIINFRTVRNVLPHLRGHVFVEYEQKRSALQAFTKLQGRYYATRQLVVEFSNLLSWRGAICGLSMARRCPRGNKCSFLHLFKNPGNKYNTMLENTNIARSTNTIQTPLTMSGKVPMTPLLSWNDICGINPNEKARNWRWSESPEPEALNKRTAALECFDNVNGRRESHLNSEQKSHRSRQKRRHSQDSPSGSRSTIGSREREDRRHGKSNRGTDPRHSRESSSQDRSSHRRNSRERERSHHSSDRSKRRRNSRDHSLDGRHSRESSLQEKGSRSRNSRHHSLDGSHSRESSLQERGSRSRNSRARGDSQHKSDKRHSRKSSSQDRSSRRRNFKACDEITESSPHKRSKKRKHKKKSHNTVEDGSKSNPNRRAKKKSKKERKDDVLKIK